MSTLISPALYGIALLPDLDTSNALINFRNQNQKSIEGPLLGTEVNLPHMSVLQCPYDKKRLTVDVLQNIYNQMALNNGNWTTEFSFVAYRPVGWVFAHVKNPEWLTNMQRISLAETEHFIDRSIINQDIAFDGYSSQEESNYREYGYYYVGDQYIPHITLGRLPAIFNKQVPRETEDNFASLFVGKAVVFNRLAFYRAGEFGVCAEIINAIDIPVFS